MQGSSYCHSVPAYWLFVFSIDAHPSWSYPFMEICTQACSVTSPVHLSCTLGSPQTSVWRQAKRWVWVAIVFQIFQTRINWRSPALAGGFFDRWSHLGSPYGVCSSSLNACKLSARLSPSTTLKMPLLQSLLSDWPQQKPDWEDERNRPRGSGQNHRLPYPPLCLLSSWVFSSVTSLCNQAHSE